MSTTVVAVSRQFGSGGARVGRAVAQRLGLQYADREILAEAARRLQVTPEDLEPLDEHAAGFWARIGMLLAQGAPDTPFIPPTLPSVSEADLFEIERQVIVRIAGKGNAVIVGRGAAHILTGRDGQDPHARDAGRGPGTLIRVFLHAPVEARVALAMTEYDLTDHAAAAVVLRDSDRARAQFVRSITGRDWCDATLYDLCIDTAAIGLDRSVDLIVDLAQRKPVSPLPPMTPRASADRVSS